MEESKKSIRIIILADDDKEDQLLFEDAIDEINIPSRVIVVGNGHELLENLNDPLARKPDIIFLDINMPVKDGKETLKEIKQDKRLRDIPCVMYSTSSSDVDIEEAYGDGANLYLTKPNSYRTLVNVIQKVLSLDPKEYVPQPTRKKFLVSEKKD